MLSTTVQSVFFHPFVEKSYYPTFAILAYPTHPQSSVEIFRLLIEKGVDVNAFDGLYYGLHFNYVYDKPGMVQILIEHGADVNHVYGKTTPLINAVGGMPGGIAVCRESSRACAPPNIVKVVKLLVEGGADVNYQNSGGWTPLLRASYFSCCHVEVIKYLISKGADVNARKPTAMVTPLHIASVGHGTFFPASLEAVELLVSAGAEVNALDCRCCETPMHTAIKKKTGRRRGVLDETRWD